MPAATSTHDIVAKFWNLCNVLKDDGVTCHQYVSELTYLLFLFELHPAGSQSFYTLAPRLRSAESADRGEQVLDRGELPSDRGELGPDRGELGADRGEQLAPSLLEAIAALGVRPRKEPLRQVIAQLCAGHWRTPAWLADQLKMEAGNLSERHLAPMVRDGTLERRYPETPTHPEQAYRTAWIQNSLLPSTSE